MFKFFNRVGLALTGLLIASGPLQAAWSDTQITGALTDATTGVAAIAAVMLGVVAAGIAVKWVLGFIIS